MNIVYIACLAFGLTLALIGAFAGGGDSDAGGADLGGGDVGGADVGGADLGADLDLGAHADFGSDGHGHAMVHADAGGTHVSFPWFSPAVIGSFFGAFGAGGLIALEVFGISSLVGQLAVAFGSGALLGGLAGFIIQRVIKAAESTSHVRTSDLVFSEGEVITEIPAEGVGEIAVSAGGSRMTFPARSESGRPIRRLAQVEVTRVVGGTLYVEEHIEERFRNLKEPSDESTP